MYRILKAAGNVSCLLLIVFFMQIGNVDAHTKSVSLTASESARLGELQAVTSELYRANSELVAALKTTAQTSELKKKEDRLQGLVQKRKDIMLQLAKNSPIDFLHNVMKEEVRSALPFALQKDIEQKVIKIGKTEVLHIDDFTDERKSSFEYYISNAGQRFKIFFAGEAPLLSSGDQISVNGYLLGSTIVSFGGSAEIKILAATTPESVGDQKTLIIPITSPAVDNEQPYTKEQLSQLIFKGPFQDYYKEQSYRKVSFSGAVTDWIAIPLNDYPESVCFSSVSVIHPSVSTYLKSKAIDLSQYERVVFLFSNRGGGCGSVGKYDYTSSELGTFRISEAWVGMSLGVKGKYELYANGALVSKSNTYEEFAFTQCRIYAGKNPTSNVYCLWNGAEIYNSSSPSNWSHGLSGFSYVLAHEVGHGLGVLHANALYCSATTYYKNCEHMEYGNYFDVMGTGLYGYDDDVETIGGHFNAYYKNYLGWFDASNVRTVTKTSRQSLTPLETATGTKILKIENPLAPTYPLYVEYRQPIGFDKSLPPEAAGLHINEVSYSAYGPGAARLLNANQATNPDFEKPALLPGQIFKENGRGIKIASSTIASSSVSFNVGINPPVCVYGKFGIEGSEIQRVAGSWFSMFFILKNNDTPTCPVSSVSITSLDWGGGTISPSAVVSSAPGSESYFSAEYSLPENIEPGDYIVTVTITDTEHNRTQSVKSTVHVVPSPIISSITPEGGHSGDLVSITGSDFGLSENYVFFNSVSDGSIQPYVYVASTGAGSSISLTLPYICRESGVFDCDSEDLVELPDGQYDVILYNPERAGYSNIFRYTVGDVQTPEPLRLTAPNGGEQWDLGVMNEITWSSYEYNPVPINPSSDIELYLETLTAGEYRVMGKIVDSGKASIHWQGHVDEYGKYPPPGSYYIRIKNTRTGEWDRSDAPFTLLPLPVDLKVNGSDGPLALVNNQPISVTWTSRDTTSCNLSGFRQYPNGELVEDMNVPTSGTLNPLYVHGSSVSVYLFCTRPSGELVSDYVSTAQYGLQTGKSKRLVVDPAQVSLRVTGPNGGEKIRMGKPYKITWEQNGLVSASVALYRDDKWVRWLGKDIYEDSFKWVPSAKDFGDVSRGGVFKIYVTSERIDGKGYLDDKSDAPFEFVTTLP